MKSLLDTSAYSTFMRGRAEIKAALQDWNGTSLAIYDHAHVSCLSTATVFSLTNSRARSRFRPLSFPQPPTTTITIYPVAPLIL